MKSKFPKSHEAKRLSRKMAAGKK